MPGIGFSELLVIGIAALLVLGPARLPELARQIGQFLRELRKANDAIQARLYLPEFTEPEVNRKTTTGAVDGTTLGASEPKEAEVEVRPTPANAVARGEGDAVESDQSRAADDRRPENDEESIPSDDDVSTTTR